jgi:hypothetical protein
LQLSAIILARVLGYIEPIDLNPRGTIFYPEFTHELVERYKFQKFPQKLEEFDESKGVEFHQGKIGDKIIQKFVIWNTILVVETRSSTTDSKQILEEILVWATARFGLKFKPGMIKRFAYVSDLTFHSDVPILAGNPAITRLATETSKAVSEIWQEPVQYEPMGVGVGHDPLSRRYAIASFMISHRAESRFTENKYFSEAPLPTDKHIALLEQFEADTKRLHEATRR